MENHEAGKTLICTARISHRDDGSAVRLGDDERDDIATTIFDGLTTGELRGALYRFGLREYGRCTGKVYVDTQSRGTIHTGYAFEKREPYEDCPAESSRIETWLTVERVITPASPTIVESVAL